MNDIAGNIFEQQANILSGLRHEAEAKRLAKIKLHEAANNLSYFEADDWAYSRPNGSETARELRSAYYQACAEAERLGIDVKAEITGKGYLL